MGGLPPRRVDITTTTRRNNNFLSFVPSNSVPADLGQAIDIPKARDRLLEFFQRKQMPGDVEDILAAALNGNLHYQNLLFIAMIDSWPKLQSNINKMARHAMNAPWKIHPYKARGEKPTPQAEALAAEVEDWLFHMRPQMPRIENGFSATVKSLVFAYYMGHGVSEILWHNIGGTWTPRATKQVPARFYGYPYSTYSGGDEADRLMFNPNGLIGSIALEDFPENRFLVAINRGHTGHPAVAAPLRALSAYWLASVFGLSWFCNFVQLYGIPWRHAEIADEKDRNMVSAALANLGSAGYLITKQGTKINVLDAPGSKGSNYPQTELLRIADEQCDKFILGSTLTSGTAENGTRNLGEVHADSEGAIAKEVTAFCAEVITSQMVRDYIVVNYGKDRQDMPTVCGDEEDQIDEKAAAERMTAIKGLSIPVGRQWAYENLNVPLPAEGEETIFGAVEPAPEQDPTRPPKAIQASDASHKIVSPDEIASSVLEGLTGVQRQWLAGVKPFFSRLAALAMSEHVTDADFEDAMKKAMAQLPELFQHLDTKALADAMNDAIKASAAAGAMATLKKP